MSIPTEPVQVIAAPKARPVAATGLGEKLAFLRGLVANPKGVSALTPSSAALARAMANQIPVGGEVLELGPGTGAVTRAILARGIAPSRLTVVEYDEAFARTVAERFAGIRVLSGDAFALERLLGPARETFAATVSGLPLLNQPREKRHAVIMDALARMKAGAPFIQVSYGARPAMPASPDYSVERAAFVWRNLPPAFVWVYRRR